MAKLSVSAWIGNAAAVLCGSFGSVARRAREGGCSRQTIYKHAARVEQAVEDSAADPVGGCPPSGFFTRRKRLRPLGGARRRLWNCFVRTVL